MWDSVPEGLPATGWAELDENGWGALIGWAAGPENLRRGPRQDDSARTVAVTRTDRDGNVVKSVEAFTAEDRHIVEEEANAYLAEAGVEQRPPGFRWFVRLPAQFLKLGRVLRPRPLDLSPPGSLSRSTRPRSHPS